MVIGIIGAVSFLGIGSSGILPWVFAGPVAATFVTGWILNELNEYVKGRTDSAPAKPKVKPRIERKVSAGEEPVASSTNPELAGVATIPAKSFKKYPVLLAKGEMLTAEAGADEWISLELLSLTESAKKESGKRYSAERGKDGKNLTIEYKAKRNGNWVVCVQNDNKTPLEVGVTLTVEA